MKVSKALDLAKDLVSVHGYEKASQIAYQNMWESNKEGKLNPFANYWRNVFDSIAKFVPTKQSK